MKRHIRIIFSVTAFALMVFFLIKFASFLISPSPQKIMEFSEVKSVYDTDGCYFDGEFCYMVNDRHEYVQVFNKDGIFERGFTIPSKGGIMWTGYNDALYVYAVRQGECVKIDGLSCTKEDIYFANEEQFRKTIEAKDEYRCKIKGLSVIQGGQEVLRLFAPRDVLSLEMCFIVAAMCMVVFLWASGWRGVIK